MSAPRIILLCSKATHSNILAPGRQVIDPLSYQVLSYLRDAPRDLLAKYCLASAGAYVSPNVTV